MKRLIALLIHRIGRTIVQVRGPVPALWWFRTALRLDDKPGKIRYDLARSLWQAAELNESATSYRALIQDFPRDARLRLEYAQILQMLERHSNALSELDHAAELAPENAVVHYTRGVSFVALGQLEEALSSFRVAVNLDPSYLDAVGNLGATLGDLRRWDEAILYHLEALKLGSNVVSEHNLGVALAEVGRFEEAEQAFRRALALERSHEIETRLAEVVSSQGRSAEAIAILQSILNGEPQDVHARTALAGQMLIGGRPIEAVELALDTLRFSPSNPELYRILGWAYIAREDDLKALEAFEEASRLKPGQPEIDAGYASALGLLGRHDEALGVFQRILIKDPVYFERDEAAAAYFQASKEAVNGPQ